MFAIESHLAKHSCLHAHFSWYSQGSTDLLLGVDADSLVGPFFSDSTPTRVA